MKKPNLLRFIAMTFIASILSMLFVFLGSPFLRVLRNVFGPVKYWGAIAVLGAALWAVGLQPLALLLLSLWLVVGLYSEVEERGYAGFYSAMTSVLLSSSVLVFGMIFWTKASGVDITDLLKQTVDSISQQIATKSGNSAIKLDAEAIIAQVPSAVVLLMLTALGFALMLERRTAQIMGVRFERIATHMRLLEFRLPEFMIWLTMFSFLLSFLKIQPTSVGVVAGNLFNIMMGLYFFQGLAVLEVSFLAFRIGNFTRFLVYFFVVGQLFLLLSAVGVIDYWVDFRGRIKRLRPREGNPRNGEHI